MISKPNGTQKMSKQPIEIKTTVCNSSVDAEIEEEYLKAYAVIYGPRGFWPADAGEVV
jgi:hypothetical protein